MRIGKVLGLIALTGLAVGGAPARAPASSHREAPLITTMPKTDGTDFYMFNSYETAKAGQGLVDIIANYQPLEDPFAGPNYYTMDPEALYDINIDNDGDALPEYTFRFQFTNTIQNLSLPINGVNVEVPLVNIGGISAGNSANSNVVETYTVQLITYNGKKKPKTAFLTNVVGGTTVFTKPTDNIGNKTFGSPAAYETYADQYIYNVNIPNCSTPGRMFVGQRKDPFVVNLGETFDLINISNPTGAPNEASDALAGKNVTSIELEVPASCIVQSSTQPIIGGWTTASLPEKRTVLAKVKKGATTLTQTLSKKFVEVSRLGNPLVNELVIGLPDKDKWNSSQPIDDPQFLTYVTNPTAPALIQALFPSVTAPTLFPRADLEAVFLTGLSGLNQPPNVVASEEMRLNTAFAVTPFGLQSRLGALGGDDSGYPNGRRPGDDVVDITLQVAMGALINPGGFGFGTPSQAPSGNLPFTDGAYLDETFFNVAFPYLLTPIPGSPNGPVPGSNGVPVNGGPAGT
ncbi:MAG TPA: DUF4331 domain-containing protein [Candidatus Binataceae bacterium]|nr:DUF4331 domain-containing protein [Candidatus Binataceae bacterium]